MGLPAFENRAKPDLESDFVDFLRCFCKFRKMSENEFSWVGLLFLATFLEGIWSNFCFRFLGEYRV